jgi:SPP1 family predicted phage head-tail adaptor
MKSGSLRHRITVRRKGDVPDGKGAFTRGWTTVAQDIPAEIISLNGREAMIGQAFQSVSSFKITVRYRTDLLPTDQILCYGMELNLRSAQDPDGRRERTDIYADNLTPQGA